ncbi:hypothetical protein FOA43_000363 [Brettanomyces nanus]|uniref:DHHA2 domain-containing protein n=1 Tax=Eeniella nana TaxID=13502 RepID=A0A875RZH3_EENNA|nr:uncharacterized protein FOA43_000363 [Brettanomyces nanus]QPG73059.1 hypothetical protein FOA43_000363 [Brettanomyces nanus]
MSLTAFLKTSKANLIETASRLSKLTLVTGNQSSDMDSVVSAIAYSYFTKPSDTPILPLLNIPRADLGLRRDIEYALKLIDIQAEDLIFADDLHFLPRNIRLNLVLVDHNKPEGENEEMILKAFNTHVTAIIDHHDDEHLFLHAEPRLIQVTGSCSSLVLGHFQKGVLNAKLDLATVKFLVSAILLDTGFLTDKYKTKQTDVDILNHIKAQYPELSDEELSQENTILHKQKKSVEGFNFKDILRKDYKEYNCGKLKTGISSVSGSLDQLEATFGYQNMVQDLKELKGQRNLSLMVMMASYNSKSNNVHCRQMVLVGDANSALSSDTAAALENKLQLEVKVSSSSEEIKAFEQLNTAASRKQVAPLITEYLKSV